MKSKYKLELPTLCQNFSKSLLFISVNVRMVAIFLLEDLQLFKQDLR